MAIVKMAKFLLTILVILFTGVMSSCNQSKISIDNIKKKVSNEGGSTAKSITVSNVDVTNNQLVIDGVNLDTATSVRVTGPAGFDETFAIETQSNSQIVANSLSNLTMLVNGLFSLIVSNAHGAATYSLTFELQDGQVTAAKLNSMGAVAGEVLTYDGTNWGPAPLTGLSYQGTFDATAGDQTSGTPAAGHYYIVTTAGSNDPDGLNNGNTFTVGDWAVYNGTTSQWDVVIGSNAVVSVAGKVGAVTLSWADFSKAGSLLSEISNVDVTGRADGDILVWNATLSKWEVGQRTTDTNTNAITECGAGQVLLGDGSCSTYVADTNAATICADGQYLDGDGTCYAVPVDTNTTYTNGTGLLLTGTTFSVDVGTGANQIVRLDGSGALPPVDGSALTNISASSVAVQNITSSATNYFGYQPNGAACGNGQVLEWNGAQGWVCGDKTTDNDTTYSAGAGLNLTGTTFSIPAQGVTNTMVSGVTANCSSGEVLKANGTGGFSCATDVGGAGDADANKLKGENLDPSLATNTTTDGQILVWSQTNTQWEIGTLPTDNDTTYSAGTGLSLSGTTFSVNPDTTTTLGTSDTVVPSQNAVKTYVDAEVGAINESQWTTTGSDIYYNTGVVGVGTTTPTAGYVLDAAGDIFVQGNIKRSVDTGINMVDGDIAISVNSRNAIRGTRAGAVAVTIGDALDATGTVTVKNNSTFEKNVEVKGTDVSNTMSIINESSTTAQIPSFKVQNYTGGNGGYPAIDLTNARGSSGTPAATNAADPAGLFQFWGHDGSAAQRIGSIGAYTEATTTGASSPGFLQFNTTTTSSTVPSEKMRITGSGNVGINESTPNEKLTIDGAISIKEGTAPTASADYGKIYVNSTDSKLYFVDDAGTSFDLTATGTGADNLGNHTATQNIDLGANKLVGNGGTNGIVINSSGNVGIGTTTPTNKLHVSGGATFFGSDLLIYKTSGGAPQVKTFLNLNTPASGTGLGSYGLGDGNAINVELNAVATETHAIGSNYGAAFVVKTTENATTTAVERIRVDHDGKVGIGTSAPLHGLTVTDGSVPEGSPVIAAGELDKAISIQGDGKAYFIGRDITNNIEYAMGTSTAGGAFAGSMTNHNFWIRTNNVTRMTFDTTGKVGIGTTTPAVELDVNTGVINASAICDENNANCLDLSAGVGGSDNLGNHTATQALDLANNYLVGNGGTTGIAIASSGNVGIGTTSPAKALHVAQSNAFQLRLENTGAGGGFWNIGESNSGWGSGGDKLLFVPGTDDSTAAAVVFQDDGNVGIGVLAPEQKLDVQGKLQLRGNTKSIISSSTAANREILEIRGKETIASGAGINLYGDLDSSAPGEIKLFTGNATRLTVDNTGKVGIGTITPAVALDVDTGVVNASAICDENNANCIDLSAGVAGDNLGNHTATTNILMSGNRLVTDADQDTYFKSTSDDQIDFVVGGSNGLRMWAQGLDTNLTGSFFLRTDAAGGATNPAYSFAGDLDTGLFRPVADNIAITTNGSEKVRITATGEVGIGLADPTEQLATEGDGVQSTMGMNTYREASSGSKFIFRQSRGSRSSKTASQAGDYSNISFRAYDGSTFGDAAEIRGGSDSTATAGSTPGRLRFYTTPSGSTTASERMIIDSSGYVGIRNTDPTSDFVIGESIGAGYAVTADSQGQYGAIIQTRQATPSNAAALWVRTTPDSGTTTNTLLRVENTGNAVFGSSTTNNSGSNSNSKVVSISGDGATTTADGRLELVNPQINASVAAGSSAGRMFFMLPNNGAGGSNGIIAQIQAVASGTGGVNGFGGDILFGTKADNGAGGATAKMVLKNNGFVGINKTNPGSALDVNGTIRAVEICDETGANCSDVSAGLGGSSGDPSYASSASSPNDAVYVNDSGFVGIGTTTPGVALHIKSSEGLRVERTGSAGFLQLESDVANPTGSSVGLIDFIGLDSAANRTAYSSIIGGAESHTDTAENGFLTLRTSKNGTMTERVRVTSDGRVGVGTNAPTSLMHLTEPDDTWNSSFRMDRSYDSSTDYFQMMYDYEGFKVRTMANGTDEAHLIFKPLNVEAMRITQDGNVGIGTTTPAVALDVNTGVINASSICDENNANCIDLSVGVSGADNLGNHTATQNINLGNFKLVGQGGSNGISIDSSGNVDFGTTVGLKIGSGTSVAGSSWGSLAGGFSSSASSISTFAFGSNVTASNWYAFASGEGTTAAGRASVAMGEDITVNGSNSIGFGLAQNGTPPVVADSNTMAIMGGEVGIGTVSPTQALEVNGNIALTSTGSLSQGTAAGYLSLSSGAGAAIRLHGETHGAWPNSMDFRVGASQKMLLDGNGNLGIGTTAPSARLEVVGDIKYSGTITDVSDRRLKDNIEPLEGALDKIRQVEAFSYVMKDDEKRQKEFGFMAQDFLHIFPELVRESGGEDNFLSLNYIGVIPWAVLGLQELDALFKKEREFNRELFATMKNGIKENRREIASLKEENQELKSRVKNLEEDMAQMKKQMEAILSRMKE